MTEPRPKKKQKHKRNLIVDWIIYVFFRIFVLFLYLFNVETNLKFARFLGRLLWKYYHRGRKRAIENLHASFPEKDEKWIEQTGVKSFENLAMMVIDVIFMPRLVKKTNWRQYSRYVKAERTKWMLKEGKGLIMVTAHYGNFEIVGYLLSLFGFEIYSIARPLDNAFISRHLYGVRQRTGLKIVDKKGAAAIMDKIISSGTALGFIGDQDAGRKGIFIDFFGRKASTYKSIGLLAITNNIPIVVGYSRRIDNRFFFEIATNRTIYPDEWKDKDDPLKFVTEEYTMAIEQFIREDPTQYWWLHRRWKHRPKEELAKQS